jgi:tetratricopeptide (TPR) repeat protein
MAKLRARDPTLWSEVTISFDSLHFAMRKMKVAEGKDESLKTAFAEVGKLMHGLELDPWDRELRVAEVKFEEKGEDGFSPFLDEARLRGRTASEIGRLGVILLGVPDREEQGRGLIDRAVDLEPDCFWLRAVRGGLSLMASDRGANRAAAEAARRDYEVATALRPKSGLMRGLLGVALVLQGDLDRSYACIEKATQVEPSSALVWTMAASFYDQSPFKDKALEAARRALELDPSIERARDIVKRYGGSASRRGQ